MPAAKAYGVILSEKIYEGMLGSLLAYGTL